MIDAHQARPACGLPWGDEFEVGCRADELTGFIVFPFIALFF
jgi:hypothetical protein